MGDRLAVAGVRSRIVGDGEEGRCDFRGVAHGRPLGMEWF